ncbi:MAG: hypothetical protein LAQ69_43565, partial [Acidobacteriia bacterium]|nr:hypothetical protein [Terriglobia bacterium]
MTCGYCGARISEEGRCLRCRRKPEDTLTGEVALNRTEGALAAQMQPSLLKHAGLVGIPGAARPGSKLARPVQGSLFWERPAGKVVALESFQTPPTSTVARPRATGAMPSPGTLVRRPSRVAEEQGTLDFLPSAQAKPRTLGTKVDAVIYCEE